MLELSAITTAFTGAVVAVVIAVSAALGPGEPESLKRFAPMEANFDQSHIRVVEKSSFVVCGQTYPFAPSGFRIEATYGHTRLLDRTGFDRLQPRRCALYTAPTAAEPLVDRVSMVLRGETLNTTQVVVQPASV